MLNRTIPPVSVIQDKDIELQQAQSFSLENGIPFHTLLTGPQPLVRLEIIFEAGGWYEKKNNLSYFTAKMLSAGTSKHSAEQIENKIAYYGAFIDLESNCDRVTLTLYSLSKYLLNLLPLVVELITESTFPEDELENLKKITIQNLNINNNKTSYLASVAFKERVFGNEHPYGKSLSEKDILSISREDITNFFKDNLSSKNCHIILSGNGDIDFYSVVNEYFGKLNWGTLHQFTTQYIKKATPGALVIAKEGSMQSSLRIGKELFTVSDPDYLKTYFLIEILGGYFGSRLMKNIREEKGFTYGVHANLISFKHSGYLVIGTDVDKENTTPAIEEIYKEIEILKTQAVPMSEMETVKNYLLGTFSNSITTPFSLADKFKTIYFHDLGYSFYSNYIHTIKSITPKELLDIANKYFNKNEIIEVAAGA